MRTESKSDTVKLYASVAAVFIFGVLVPSFAILVMLMAAIYDIKHGANRFVGDFSELFGPSWIYFTLYVIVPSIVSIYVGIALDIMSVKLSNRQKVFRVVAFIFLNMYYLIYRSVKCIRNKTGSNAVG